MKVSIKHRRLGWQQGFSTNGLYVLDARSSDRRPKAVALKLVVPRWLNDQNNLARSWCVQTIGFSIQSFFFLDQWLLLLLVDTDLLQFFKVRVKVTHYSWSPIRG